MEATSGLDNEDDDDESESEEIIDALVRENQMPPMGAAAATRRRLPFEEGLGKGTKSRPMSGIKGKGKGVEEGLGKGTKSRRPMLLLQEGLANLKSEGKPSILDIWMEFE